MMQENLRASQPTDLRIGTVTSAEPLVITVDTAAAPWGILSVLLIFFVGGGLYFFVLPRYLEKK